MIDHAYRCIFIHQRKAAGASIISSFGLTTADANWHLYNSGVLSPEWRKRTPAERRYFVFSVVRNPYDRVISGWQYLEALRDRSLKAALEKPPRRGHDYRHFTRPQIALLRNRRTGKLVTDDLIRFETCQEDFDRICDRIGKPRRALGWHHLNEARDRDYRRYYDDETRALVSTMFREDIETFGYSF
jgi:hypothetical protein